MRGRAGMRVAIACAALAAAMQAARGAAAAGGGDPVAEINAQYETVLQVIRRPAVTGVLATEILPESAGGAAGLRAGDIITEYYGTKIAGLESLRGRVADALAERIHDATETRVPVRVRRFSNPVAASGEEVVLQVTREPLGIRAVEVAAAVPGPRNPPASRRGELKLDWKGVLESLRADDDVFALRLQERPPAPAGAKGAEEPLGDLVGSSATGWQQYKVTSEAGGETMTMECSVSRAGAGSGAGDAEKAVETSLFACRLRLGDFNVTPAFLLDAARAGYPLSADRLMTSTATRAGEMLNVEFTTSAPSAKSVEQLAREQRAIAVPLTAIIQPALPLVAAALPHEKDAGLAIHLMSVRDYLPRPGYVLATRGQQPLPPLPAITASTSPSAIPFAAPPDTAWRVDLVHFGVVIESYWFSDQRRLLAIESDISSPVIHRRVLTSEDAAVPAQPKPAATAPRQP